jgi:hypothetical protein
MSWSDDAPHGKPLSVIRTVDVLAHVGAVR